VSFDSYLNDGDVPRERLDVEIEVEVESDIDT
jgi:hypothetical protein